MSNIDLGSELMNITIEKIENGYFISLKDSSYRTKDYAFVTLDEALEKVKEVYGR